MKSRLNDLWASAANDGASSPIGIYEKAADTDAEVDMLMDAWLRERSDRIESSLILDQAQRLMIGLLSDGAISPRRRRQAIRLIRAIRSNQKGDRNDSRP